MKYVLLTYRDEKEWATLSSREHAAFENARLAYEQDLQQSGHLFAVENLSSNSTATVHVVNGQVSLTPCGPFIDRPGQLIQLFFIQARDLNEAIQVASKMPQARVGPIEVRSFLELDQQELRQSSIKNDSRGDDQKS